MEVRSHGGEAGLAARQGLGWEGGRGRRGRNVKGKEALAGAQEGVLSKQYPED